jgi:hypothetical protein
MAAAHRMFAVSVALVVLTWVSFLAVRYGVAGSASANASREIERISRAAGGASSDRAWKDALRRAVAEVPDDPTPRELLALAVSMNSSNPLDLAAARGGLVNAIANRPGSGYTWAELAAVKYRLGETDAMFEKALVNAVSLGPYEPEVQRDVVNYGLAVLDEVRPETRRAIEAAVAAGMKRNAPEILQISARRGRLGAACRHLDGVPRPAASKWTQLCQSMEATS